MARAQSSPTPAAGARPRWHDAGWLARYAVVGLFELVRARIAFARLEARDIPARNRRAAAGSMARLADSATMIDRIAYVIPRLAHRLPWRSDCLIQAIAAQNWLARHGLVSEIRIGVERPADRPFGAHAWLVREGRIVTGGEITQYDLLLGGEPEPPEAG